MLVWRAETVAINPSVDRKFIDAEYEKDPTSARAEYGAEFRDDLESFVSPEAVDRVVARGRTYLPHEPGHRYVGFAAPAGASGQDSMTLAIARKDGDRAALCRVAEWRPPFSPDQAAAEAAEILREYGLKTVTGDHYGGDWPASRFEANGVVYMRADKSKSDLYGALLPLINAGGVRRSECRKGAGVVAQGHRRWRNRARCSRRA